tara:strand:+ start:583 stop:1938 length:1356 start_codon:yes stop_codon:yes gene_type:complete
MAKKKGSSGQHGTRMSMNRYLKKNDQERSKHMAKGVSLDINYHDIFKDPSWDGVERMADNMKKRKLGRDSQGVRYWEDNGPTLSNTLLAALAEPRRGISGYDGGKYAEAMRRNVQSQIATAQKFVVSNSMVEHAYLASMARPTHLIQMLQRGIPPFNNMWIEWDEDFRRDIVIREMDKLGIDARDNEKFVESMRTTARVGYHIQMVNDRFMYTNYFHSHEVEKLYSSPLAFHMSNDGMIRNNDPNQDHDAFLTDVTITSTCLLGNWYKEKYLPESVDKNNPLSDHDMSMGVLLGSFAQMQSSSMHWLAPQQKFAQGFTHKEMADMKALSLTSQAGDGRFLIALLGLLNYDLVVHETTTPPKKIDHVRFGRVVPKNEYKVVTIQLPKPRGKRIYEQMFTGHGSPKKEHWRRGHWRTLKDKFGRIKKRVWISEMKVGNPELGTIVHDYKLEGK